MIVVRAWDAVSRPVVSLVFAGRNLLGGEQLSTALSWQPIGVLLFDDLDAFFGFFSPQPIRLGGGLWRQVKWGSTVPDQGL